MGVLLEEGEHGYLAARTCSQVIKAYVEKQRKRAVKMADTRPQGPVDVAAVWSRAAEGDADAMQAGRFRIDVKPASPAPDRQNRALWGPQSRRLSRGRPARARHDAAATGGQ